MEFKIENDELVIIAGVIVITHVIGGIILYNLPINAFVESFVGGSKKTMESFKEGINNKAKDDDDDEGFETFE